MKKVLGVIAALAMVGVAGVANAADSQDSRANQPAELSSADMDQVTAGAFLTPSGAQTRVINMGRYSLVYDGSKWFRQKNG